LLSKDVLAGTPPTLPLVPVSLRLRKFVNFSTRHKQPENRQCTRKLNSVRSGVKMSQILPNPLNKVKVTTNLFWLLPFYLSPTLIVHPVLAATPPDGEVTFSASSPCG
jgi:hypothetical protein